MSPEDDEIIWDVEGSIKDCIRIQKNLSMFDNFVRGVLNNKILKKTMKKTLSKEDANSLEDMLKNHTSVTIIKKATTDEIVENNKTWWQNIKETFTKKEDDDEDKKNGK